jgi:hypothetical protein
LCKQQTQELFKRMRTQQGVLVTAALVCLVALSSSKVLAQASGPEAKQVDVQIGYLSCHVSSGFGLILGSSRDVNCTYTPTDGKPPQNYRGTINKFGADIGYLQSGVILWTVLAPSNAAPNRTGLLAGNYAGATTSASLGLGAGVHVLVGGMHDTIALQPISIEGNTGLNVAAGIATMSLESVPTT